MKIVSNNHTVRSNKIQHVKDFNSQYLSTKARKGEKLVSMMPAIRNLIDLMRDGMVYLSTENDTSKKQVGDYDQKWLEESQAKLLKQIHDEKRAKLIMFRMQTRMKKY